MSTIDQQRAHDRANRNRESWAVTVADALADGVDMEIIRSLLVDYEAARSAHRDAQIEYFGTVHQP